MGWFTKNKSNSKVTAPATPPIAAYVAQAPPRTTGLVRGKHFTEWVDKIDELSRAERNDDALTLLYECIKATEEDSRAQGWDAPAPAYTTKAAILLRRMKRPSEEAAVLERYLAASNAKLPNGEIVDRLRKVKDILAAVQAAEAPPACPACGQLLDSAPKSKATCKSCGSAIVVRKVGGQSTLFTPAQAEAYAEADKFERAKRKLLLIASNFSSEADWDTAHDELRAQFGSEPGLEDVFWRLANDAIALLTRDGDWARMIGVYAAMEKHLVTEGRDWVHIGESKANATKALLQQYDSPSSEMILIACTCPACSPENLRVATLDVFLKAWPLPHEACELPPCRCSIQRKYY